MIKYLLPMLISTNSETHTEHAVSDTLAAVSGHASDTLAAVAGHAAEASGHGAEHAAPHAPEFPNILEMLNHVFHTPVTQFMFDYQIVFYSLVATMILMSIALLGYRKRSMIPGPAQNFMEWIVESLSGLVIGILGEKGRKFIPFIGTLFLYIFCMNMLGIIPGMFSSTSKLNTTLALAICVFLYVQFHGMRDLGVIGYFHHLAGSPKSVVEWCLVPLNLPLHVIGELAKPMSLSLRLFGNISGEDMLLAIFATLGVAMLSFMEVPFGVPLHVPFIFLAMLTSFVQALVFSLLTTIYFSLMSHHEDEHH